MDVEKYIAALKEEQAATALRGLLRPQGRDSYEYGKHSGVVLGLERALQILQTLQDASDGRERHKQRPAATAVNPYLADLDAAPTLPEQWGRG